MFYKILYKSNVIDVLNRLDYATYIKDINKFIITDKSSACCIVASNRHEFYHVHNLKYPEGIDLITVTLIEISETEYTDLCTQLFQSNSDDVINSTLDILKDCKIKEMSTICHQNIVDGIQVPLSDERLHHFELTLEDQINLLEIKNQLDNGVNSVIYHETGKSCCEFSREDMYMIVNTYIKHKQFHLTQFNKLRDHILSLETISEVAKVKYDLSL
jgi:hypothetical protein